MKFNLPAGIVGIFVLLPLIYLNMTQHGPVLQTSNENYLVHYSAPGYLPQYRDAKYTVLWQGWPLGFKFNYPQGYVSPDDPLAWDVDPVYEGFSWPELALDIIACAILGMFGYAVAFFGMNFLARHRRNARRSIGRTTTPMV